MVAFANFLNLLNPSAPKGLIRSAEAWVRSRNLVAPQLRQSQPASTFRQIFPAEENIRLVQAGQEASPFVEYQTIRWTITEAANLFYLSGARLLGREGTVISPDNRVFAEFTMPPSSNWHEHSCFKRRSVPPIKRLGGWYATIAWPESEFFFHWMIESLPRMALLKDHTSILDGLFVSGRIQNFHIEALAKLGIPESKLIQLSADCHFQPEHLFVPRAFAMYNPPRWLVQWFRSSFIGDDVETVSQTATRHRLYISRADAPARRISNESEVEEMLAPFGFMTIRLSALSVSEQATLFSQAEIIVAGHGAGLSNIVFCNPGTRIIEIMAPRWMAPCFMSLAVVADCVYRYVIGEEGQEGHEGVTPQRQNVMAPIKRLSQVLSEFI